MAVYLALTVGLRFLYDRYMPVRSHDDPAMPRKNSKLSIQSDGAYSKFSNSDDDPSASAGRGLSDFAEPAAGDRQVRRPPFGIIFCAEISLYCGGKCGGGRGNSFPSTPKLFKYRPTLHHCPTKISPPRAANPIRGSSSCCCSSCHSLLRLAAFISVAVFAMTHARILCIPVRVPVRLPG